MIASALRRSAVSAFVFTLPVAGCSLVSSTDDARRPGPSTPTLHVDPPNPVTTDALRVVLDTPSVDRYGRDVTYEYEWTKQGAPAVVGTTETIDASATTRGDVFTVRVTPVADGRYRGHPVAATVTVGNAPPVVSYAGLSRYDVFRDDTLEVFAGPTTDADGDLVTRRIAWRVDGTPLAVSSSQLALSTLTLAAGSRVEVIVTPNDGIDDGIPVTVGPARVRGPGTQWRELVPEHGPHGSMGDMLGWLSVFDPARNRLLFFEATTIATATTTTNRYIPWEYALDAKRWARLVVADATGGDFATFARPIHDPAGQRLILYGEPDPDAALVPPRFAKQLRMLHLDQRGSESWELVPLAADSPAPPWRFGESVIFDAANRRIVIYGGMSYGGDVFDDLWALHLDPGNVRWERLATSTSFGPLVGATFLVDAKGGAAYLAGGMFDETGAWPPEAVRTDVYRFDLASNTFAGGPVAQLPTSRSLASAIPLPDGSGALLVGGVADLDAQLPVDVLHRFDFATRTIADVTPPAGPLVGHLGVWPSLAVDPGTGRIHVATTGGDTGRGVSFYSLAADGHDLAAVDVYGVTTPPALSQLGAAHDSGTLSVFFGLREALSFGTDLAENGVWTWGSKGRFEVASPAGRPTEGRFGFSFAADPDGSGAALIVGGHRLVGGAPAPALDVYRLGPTTAPGITSLGTLSPSADYAHAALAACGGSTLALLGGDGTASGVATVSGVQCASGTCAVSASSGTLPTGALGSATYAAFGSGFGYLVGGEGTSAGVWSFAESYVCAGTGIAAVAVPVASFPSVVGAASFVLPPGAGATTFSVLVIGSWDDGGVIAERVGALVVPMTNPATGGTFAEVALATSERPSARFHSATVAAANKASFFVYGGQQESYTSGATHPFSDLWQLRYEAP